MCACHASIPQKVRQISSEVVIQIEFMKLVADWIFELFFHMGLLTRMIRFQSLVPVIIRMIRCPYVIVILGIVKIKMVFVLRILVLRSRSSSSIPNLSRKGHVDRGPRTIRGIGGVVVQLVRLWKKKLDLEMVKVGRKGFCGSDTSRPSQIDMLIKFRSLILMTHPR